MSRITIPGSKLRRGPSAPKGVPARDPWIGDLRRSVAKLERDVYWLVRTLAFVTVCLTASVIVAVTR